MREIPRAKTHVNGIKRYIWFEEDIPLCLFRMFMKKGMVHRIYTPGDPTMRFEEEAEGISKMSTITVIPPPGYARIHSSGLDRPLEWPGTLNVIGGGVWFQAEFDYEAVEDSFWICVTGPEDPAFRKDNPLSRVVITPDEPFVFTEDTRCVVSMWGDHESKCFKGEPGDKLEVNRETLLAVWEYKPNV